MDIAYYRDVRTHLKTLFEAAYVCHIGVMTDFETVTYVTQIAPESPMWRLVEKTTFSKFKAILMTGTIVRSST